MFFLDTLYSAGQATQNCTKQGLKFGYRSFLFTIILRDWEAEGRGFEPRSGKHPGGQIPFKRWDPGGTPAPQQVPAIQRH